MLGDIEAEADRLYRIVEDLLALSRVEGGITIDGEPVLRAAPGRAGRRVGGRALGPGHVRDPAAAEPAGGVRRADLRRAGAAQPDLERRQVRHRRARPSTVEAEEAEDEVVVRVLDRGIGVSPDEADRLFELFYRSPQSARTASGAGIGLYVSRGLITAMGGRIWVPPARWRRVRVRVHAAPLPGGRCSRSRAGRPAGARADRRRQSQVAGQVHGAGRRALGAGVGWSSRTRE